MKLEFHQLCDGVGIPIPLDERIWDRLAALVPWKKSPATMLEHFECDREAAEFMDRMALKGPYQFEAHVVRATCDGAVRIFRNRDIVVHD